MKLKYSKKFLQSEEKRISKYVAQYATPPDLKEINIFVATKKQHKQIIDKLQKYGYKDCNGGCAFAQDPNYLPYNFLLVFNDTPVICVNLYFDF